MLDLDHSARLEYVSETGSKSLTEFTKRHPEINHMGFNLLDEYVTNSRPLSSDETKRALETFMLATTYSYLRAFWETTRNILQFPVEDLIRVDCQRILALALPGNLYESFACRIEEGRKLALEHILTQTQINYPLLMYNLKCLSQITNIKPSPEGEGQVGYLKSRFANIDWEFLYHPGKNLPYLSLLIFPLSQQRAAVI